MQWGVGGWLLTPFLQKIGFEAAQKLRERVAAELKTTFASHYTREVSLAEALSLEAINVNDEDRADWTFAGCELDGRAQRAVRLGDLRRPILVPEPVPGGHAWRLAISSSAGRDR